jgi:hypothetical protein
LGDLKAEVCTLKSPARKRESASDATSRKRGRGLPAEFAPNADDFSGSEAEDMSVKNEHALSCEITALSPDVYRTLIIVSCLKEGRIFECVWVPIARILASLSSL